MDKLLEKTRQAVAKYKLRSDKDKLSATKALWFALRSLRKAMKSEPEQEKLTLEMARELSELVGAAPGLLESAEQAEETARLPDDKRSADEFIAKIEAQLRGVVNQLESDKSSEINTWLESQPVLNELSKSLAEKMPESTYVLLFRGRDRLHIMTSQSP